MLDKRSLALLNIINEECLGTGYKIFAVDELAAALPTAFGMDSEVVRVCIKTLSEHEYVSVKYEDEREVCLSLLTKGRLVFENRIDEEVEKSRAEKRYFAYSFFGALIGGGILALICALVFALSGGA